MDYRLACIITDDLMHDGMSVEVHLDTRSFSPSQRKVSVTELCKAVAPDSKPLARQLFLMGLNRQPFTISAAQLSSHALANALRDFPWIYRKTGRHGGLKRVYHMPLPDTRIYSKATLFSAELHISALQQWWRSIDVRFRYEGSHVLFPAEYTDVPFSSIESTWLTRDKEAEDEYLSSLSGRYDADRCIISLSSEEATAYLQDCIARGWQLFAPQGSGNSSRVYCHKSSSGITWFSSEGEENDDDSQLSDILTAYLNRDNHVEADGVLTLFTDHAVSDIAPQTAARVLAPSPNVEKYYETPSELTEDQRTALRQRIKERVQADLKPYQEDGVFWLHKMRENNCGCMLADDMGLGKTLQTLAHLATLDDCSLRHLVICPASLVENWKNEIKRFTPRLLGNIDMTTYDKVRLNPDDYTVRQYDTIIVDEGQMVKNDNTQRHHAVATIKHKHNILLSGTPVENTIHEVWAQFRLLNPAVASLEARMHALGLSTTDERWIRISKMLLSPFILRRTKDEVLHLPDITEIQVPITLSQQERAIYERIRKMTLHAISTGVSGTVNNIALEGLLRLRQCCVSANVLPRELCPYGHIETSKLSHAVKLLRRLNDEGHKVLVFSQFTSVLDELRIMLQGQESGVEKLTGSTVNRMAVVNSFKQQEDKRIFLISLKAGGTGLNLTEADRVVFLDDWWNPAVEQQAFSRVHRIGQEHKVEVYRLVCKDTVEEKILQLHNSKKSASDLFNAHSDRLSLDQIMALLS